jgi:hypothetical protein
MIHFDIDARGLQQVAFELDATDKQVRSALTRALHRTEASLRKLSSKGLTKELQLRTAAVLRKRLKSIKLRQGKDSGVALWYGLNPLPVSSFKGRPKEDPAGAFMGDYFFKGAFVARSTYKGRNTIFNRQGKKRLPIAEETISINDDAIVFIEDEIFEQTETIFWQHFRRDLQARVKYKLGEA